MTLAGLAIYQLPQKSCYCAQDDIQIVMASTLTHSGLDPESPITTKTITEIPARRP